MIAEKVKARTVPVVPTRAGRNVDGSTCRHSRRKVKIRRGNLKFLHHFLRETHGGSAISDLHDAAAVNCYACPATIVATCRRRQQWYKDPIVAAACRLLGAGLELREFQKVAPI